MSHVKTDKLSARTASGTITLGESGETFSLPSGVTLSGAGAITVPSGGSLTINSGATLTNNGTGVGLGKLVNVWRITDATQLTTSSTGNSELTGYTTTLTGASSGNLLFAHFLFDSVGVSGETLGVVQIHLNGTMIDKEVQGSTSRTWNHHQVAGLIPADDAQIKVQYSSNQGGWNTTYYSGELSIWEMEL